MNTRTICISAGLLGFFGVLIGAFGAHALKAALIELGTSNAWETASRYHLLHAIALFALAAWSAATHPAAAARASGSRWLSAAAWCWLLGTVIFSGSIYWYALGGPRWAGAIAPIGGLSLMLGWLSVALHAIKLPRNPAA